jgi:hypothetical protein
MQRDPELDGETPLHVAGQAHYAILAPHKRVAGLDSDRVVSPLGTLVQKPIPPRENLERIQRAKELIMARLGRDGSVSLQELRNSAETNPAAVNSAIVILKREGRITTSGTTISAHP